MPLWFPFRGLRRVEPNWNGPKSACTRVISGQADPRAPYPYLPTSQKRKCTTSYSEAALWSRRQQQKQHRVVAWHVANFTANLKDFYALKMHCSIPSCHSQTHISPQPTYALHMIPFLGFSGKWKKKNKCEIAELNKSCSTLLLYYIVFLLQPSICNDLNFKYQIS